MPSTKIEIENVNVPGRTYRVDAEKYQATREALLKLLPNQSPGPEGVTQLLKVMSSNELAINRQKKIG